MTRRIAAFNAATPPLRLHADPIIAREFKLARFPAVKLTDALTEDGGAALELEYAGKSQLIPVKAPPARDLPALIGYEEWFKPLAINEVMTDPVTGSSVAKPGSERLLLVSRRTPEGFDAESWGSVRKVEWVFDIYDLKQDGGIELRTYRWPRSQRGEMYLTKRNQSATPDPREVEHQKLPILQDRSVEFFAAMYVIPKLNVPNHKFNDTAFSLRVLGWTLPTAMISLLTLTGALVFAVFPAKSVLPARIG